MATKKNSLSGTVLAEAEVFKSLLTAQEVSLILETSAKTGVTELCFGPLTFKMGTKAQVELIPLPVPSPEEIGAHDVGPAPIDPENLLQEELRAKKERLDMLLIEDPMEFERQLMDGELGDDEPGDEPAEET